MRSRSKVGGATTTLLPVTFALLVWSGTADPATLEAQDRVRRPLAPMPPGGLPVSPFMEGWYENEDGTYTISFGYLNRNDETVVEIPLGEDNYMEPGRFGGIQPTVFHPGRHRGVFAVDLPAEMSDEDVWWHIRNENGEVHRVPGRTRAEAYQLDWNVRPQGSLHPVVWFDSEEDGARGPEGIMAESTRTTTVGSPLTLSVNVRDPSERDPEDPRFRETVPVRVLWSRHQGPGEVEFTRHESTPVPEEAEEGDGNGEDEDEAPVGPEEITLPDGRGTARVIATFHEPGEYILRAQADNFEAPDSSGGNQCCWTNGYVRVTVEE